MCLKNREHSKLIMSLLFLIVLFAACKDLPKVETEQAATVEKRPNIIIIMADDLGYADVGFNGSTEITTPELDKLAANGMKFTSGYVAHPFCGPSRAALMTGRYPHTIGSQFNLPASSEAYGSSGITISETFISKMLQNAGYYTGAIGKWHLGDVPKYHPNNRGFQEFYGFLGGGHDYFPEDYTVKFAKQKASGQKFIFDYVKPLEHNKNVVSNPTEYLTDELSRKAVDFVNTAIEKKNPFFLYLAYNAPHVPLQAKKEDMQMFSHIKDKDRRTYAAMVYAVDRGVGKLVESLKANNVLDNTLIVFLSDNGGKLTKGANNYPLKEGKGSTAEGGYRVPMFFHYPNEIESNSIFNYPITTLDFYPTFAALAKAEIPEDKILDGKNVWQSVVALENPRKDDYVFVMRHREGYTDVGVRQNQWKALKTKQQTWRLFNIDRDMGEEHDLSEQHMGQLKTMVKAAEKWSKTHSEPLWFDPESLSVDWEEKEMAKFNKTFKLDVK